MKNEENLSNLTRKTGKFLLKTAVFVGFLAILAGTIGGTHG